MKRLILLTGALFSLCALCVNAYAGPQNDDGALHGNQSKAQVACGVQSLQDAVDRAAEGATINVQGTCAETVVIRKDRVRIVGEPGATVQPPDGGIAFTVLSNGVVISDLNIVGGLVGIDIAKGASADVNGNEISEYSEAGIRIRANSNAEIVDNSIDGPMGSLTAIGLLAGASAQLQGNVISSRGFGISVAATSSAFLACDNNVSALHPPFAAIVVNRTAQLAFAPGCSNEISHLAGGLALFCSQTSSIFAGANQTLNGPVILHPNCEVVTLFGVTFP